MRRTMEVVITIVVIRQMDPSVRVIMDSVYSLTRSHVKVGHRLQRRLLIRLVRLPIWLVDQQNLTC